MRKNVPALRFKGFDGEWEEKTLGEIGSVAMNRRIFKHETSECGDIPFYKIGTFGGIPDAFISRDLFEQYKLKYPYPTCGDLLISASGSIGRVIEYTGKDEYFQDSNIVWLQHDNQVVNAFLKQFYLFVKWSGLEGSTIKRLYNKNILETLIRLPNTTEQTRIGSLFRNLDSLITLEQQKHDKLKNLKKAMLEKMFPKPGATVPEVRFKGFSGEWEEKRLGEIADIIGGGTPSTSKPEYWDGDIDWYSPTEIGKFVYADGSIKKITKLGLEKSSAKLLPAYNTVLFTSRAGIGDMAILRKIGATNQGFQSLVLKDSIDTYFVYSMGISIKEYAEKNASGSTFLEIYGKILANMPVVLPNTEEQTRIGEFFRQLDSLIALQQRKCAKLHTLKKALLGKLFV